MKLNSILIVIVVVVVAVILILIFEVINKPKQLNYNVSTYNSSVSALLLSNWVNDSAFVYTGIPNPEVGLTGVPYISDIMIGNLGPFNYKFYILGGNSTKSELSLENQIIINRTNATDMVSLPVGSDSIVVAQNSSGSNNFLLEINGNVSYSLENYMAIMDVNPKMYIYSPNSSFNVSINGSNTFVHIKGKGDSYVVMSFYEPSIQEKKMLLNSNLYVNSWLRKSNNISLSGSFLTEYYTSLLLVKDDQNPVTGAFAASPSPIYLYAWVRDGSFAAMSLQDAGHLASAEKYWKWMASVQNASGTWYTRYNFWNSKPDTSYGIPEYDSVGLFQIGISSLFNITHNYSLISGFIPTINRSLSWEELNINKSASHLIPQDLSIWEDVMAYNFWTQAIDLIGMRQSYQLFSSLGIPSNDLPYYYNALNSSIENYFYNGTYYAEYASPTTIYVNGTNRITLLPKMIADSSSILPIAMGLVGIHSQQAISDVNSMIKYLTKHGGLARFTGDTYHYTLSLHDSTGPMPPWIITSLFLAYYDEESGNYTGAFNLMKWTINHSQNWLLPEAIDPNLGNPLQTTSPLTWSSAMYIITALNYKN